MRPEGRFEEAGLVEFGGRILTIRSLLLVAFCENAYRRTTGFGSGASAKMDRFSGYAKRIARVRAVAHAVLRSSLQQRRSNGSSLWTRVAFDVLPSWNVLDPGCLVQSRLILVLFDLITSELRALALSEQRPCASCLFCTQDASHTRQFTLKGWERLKVSRAKNKPNLIFGHAVTLAVPLLDLFLIFLYTLALILSYLFNASLWTAEHKALRVDSRNEERGLLATETPLTSSP